MPQAQYKIYGTRSTLRGKLMTTSMGKTHPTFRRNFARGSYKYNVYRVMPIFEDWFICARISHAWWLKRRLILVTQIPTNKRSVLKGEKIQHGRLKGIWIFAHEDIWSNWGDGRELVPLVEAQIDRKGLDGLGRVDRKSLGFAKTSN